MKSLRNSSLHYHSNHRLTQAKVSCISNSKYETIRWISCTMGVMYKYTQRGRHLICQERQMRCVNLRDEPSEICVCESCSSANPAATTRDVCGSSFHSSTIQQMLSAVYVSNQHPLPFSLGNATNTEHKPSALEVPQQTVSLFTCY